MDLPFIFTDSWTVGNGLAICSTTWKITYWQNKAILLGPWMVEMNHGADWTVYTTHVERSTVRLCSLIESSRIKFLMGPHHSDHHYCCIRHHTSCGNIFPHYRLNTKEKKKKKLCFSEDTTALSNLRLLPKVESFISLWRRAHCIGTTPGPSW